jgi:hypothetical protein
MSAMNPRYKDTVFLVRPPECGFPTRFGIVTACNPYGVVTPEPQNVAATNQLRKQLQDAGLVFFR